MPEQLNGPCCVLRAAMNFDGAGGRAEPPESALFQIIVAAVGALGFAAIYLL